MRPPARSSPRRARCTTSDTTVSATTSSRGGASSRSRATRPTVTGTSTTRPGRRVPDAVGLTWVTASEDTSPASDVASDPGCDAAPGTSLSVGGASPGVASATPTDSPGRRRPAVRRMVRAVPARPASPDRRGGSTPAGSAPGPTSRSARPASGSGSDVARRCAQSGRRPKSSSSRSTEARPPRTPLRRRVVRLVRRPRSSRGRAVRPALRRRRASSSSRRPPSSPRAAASSAPAARPWRSSRKPTARSTASTGSRIRPRAKAGVEPLARTVRLPWARSVARKRGSAARASRSRAPVASARAWRRRADGTQSTRPPVALTRHPRSTSSRRSPRSVSKPPRTSHSRRRTREPAEPTARTSELVANWPRSSSSAPIPVWRWPEASVDSPASTTSRGSSQSSWRGPRTAAVGDTSATDSSTSRQAGSGAQSSCRTQSQSPELFWGSRRPSGRPQRRSASATAAATAEGNPVSRGRVSTTSTALLEPSTRAVSSVEPVSTATTQRGRRVSSASADRASGNHVPPSWQTRTASTGAVGATDSSSLPRTGSGPDTGAARRPGPPSDDWAGPVGGRH